MRANSASQKGPAYVPAEDRSGIVLGQGRRNMSLRAECKLAIVGLIAGGGEDGGAVRPQRARRRGAGDGLPKV
jgi:hypothetical protein